MLGPRSLRRVLVALTVSLASAAFVAGAVPSVASAASPHRAAVIVDTGTTVHRVVITFTEDSISGVDALQRAGANPVVYAMGPGAAVCRMYGVGRDPGPDCLGGQDGDNRYWAYFRAPAGSSGFTYSSIGAGTARVHDGDVEGWKYGTGTAPAYVSLATLSPPPTQPPATAPLPVSPGAAPRGDDGSAPMSTPDGVVGQAPSASSTSTPPVTGSAASSATTKGAAKHDSKRGPVDHATDENGKPIAPKLASAENHDGGSGTSTWSLLLLVALLVAIAIAILVVRRARRHAT